MASEKITEVYSFFREFLQLNDKIMENANPNILRLLDKLLLELKEFINKLKSELVSESALNASVEDLMQALAISSGEVAGDEEVTSEELHQISVETGIEEVTCEELLQMSEETGNEEVTHEELLQRAWQFGPELISEELEVTDEELQERTK